MSAETITPVELVAPLPRGLDLRTTPTSNVILRLVTAAIILATTTIIVLSRPSGMLADSAQVTITGP